MSRPGAQPRRSSLLVAVGRPAVTKVVVMGLTGLIGMFTSRLIISSFGTDAYAQYGLLTSFPALLPFADLGIAAVLLNVVAGSAHPSEDPTVRRTITTAFRVLLAAGGVIIALAVLLTVLGAWPTLLGGALLDGSGLAPMLSLVVFGLVLPMTIGQRVIVGLGRTTTQVASQAVVAPFMILSVWTVVALGARGGDYLAVLSYVANSLVSVICLVVVWRALHPALGKAVRDIPRLRSAPGVKVLSTAWPMLVQMLALPVAMQTDRLLLSHLTRGDELAQYNLASQLFTMVVQGISAGGLALWPIYARARAEGEVRSPARPSLAFLGAGLVLGSLLALVAPYLADFISDGAIELDTWLVVAFVAFVAVQAAKYPVGMYMTDQRGLTFQVAPILIMVPLNLGLSWVLIGYVGAAGPILGSAVSVLLCQVVPNLLYVRRDLARRRAAGARALDEVP